MSKQMKTKKVRITLAALTRVEYTEVLEVPVDMTDDDLSDLVDKRYDEVDGGMYQSDPEYWERGSSCGYEDADISEEATVKVEIDEDGDLLLSENSED